MKAWPSLLAAAMYAGACVNLGVGGTLTERAVVDQLPAAIGQRPTIVTVQLGINELNARVAPAGYEVSLRTMVHRLVAETRAAVFVVGIPDMSFVPVYANEDKAQLAARVTALNAVMTRVVGAEARDRAWYVDLWAPTFYTTKSTSTMFSSDGFHPNDVGYALLVERLLTVMRAAGVVSQ